MAETQKIVIVGAGLVGTSLAYALITQCIGSEIILIDIDKRKAEGEALDLSHGAAFSPRTVIVKSGTYKDLEKAQIVVIAAGASQAENETRIDLLKKNKQVVKNIVKEIKKVDFKGIYLVATNPVDLISKFVFEEAGVPAKRIIGSGTVLDTARLRHEIAKTANVHVSNVHALILGEHGDTEFVCWSNATISVKPIIDFPGITAKDRKIIENKVRNAAYEIIERKLATYYGIGMALAFIINAILDDKRSILSVSTLINSDYYGIHNLFIGLPVLVSKDGVQGLIELKLNKEEKAMLKKSADFLKDTLKNLK
ncbi:MAG: L-lactate dehydrogenase [Erysipelotrichales bacterium]|nr:L-lactate dehydrogenase [Erysipelotrichales bacterium]